jgi:hypothetical protein
MVASAPPVPGGMLAIRHPIRGAPGAAGTMAASMHAAAGQVLTAQQASTVAGAAAMADPAPAPPKTRSGWPGAAADAGVPERTVAVAGTPPGRGPGRPEPARHGPAGVGGASPADLVALVEGLALQR